MPSAEAQQQPQPREPEMAMVPLRDILTNPRNPRVHPAEQIDRLVEILRRHGQTRPLMLRRHNQMLIAGHGVREAMLRLGWTEARCILLDVSQQQADRMMLADNRSSDLSRPHEAMVQQLLAEFGKDDWPAVGYSEPEAFKLLQPFEQQAGAVAARARVKEVATSAVADTFWISVRGPLAQQADAMLAVEQAVASLGGVTVELGTIKDRTR